MTGEAHDSQELDTAELMRRYRAGERQVAEQLFERYAVRLCRCAEQHLSQRLKQRMDGEDVAQSVFRTFFRRVEAGRFQIDSASQLWRLLVTITVRKAQKAGRRIDRQVNALTGTSAEGDYRLMVTLTSEPGPEEAVALADTIDVLLDGLSPWHALVLEQRLAGATPSEIVRDHGRNRDAVYSALKDLQKRLTRQEPPDAPPPAQQSDRTENPA